MSEKRKELIRTVKFALCSASAALIQIGAFTLCMEVFGWKESVSNAVAVVLSVLWNFTLNRKFTFQSANNVPIAMLKVVAFYAVFIPLSSWWTAVLTEQFSWNGYVVEIMNMLINFVTEYLYQRFFVFRTSLDTAQKKTQ